MDWATFLLGTMGGAAGGFAVVAWLGKSWISHRLSRDIEEFKTKLSQKTEALKTELAIYAHEQNVGLSRLDTQRSEAILEIWKVLSEWQEAYIAVTAPNERLHQHPNQAVSDYEGQARRMYSAADHLSRLVRDRSIFFSASDYTTLARCGQAIANVTFDFVGNTFEGRQFASTAEREAHLAVVLREREKLRVAVASNVNELRAALLESFRRLMSAARPERT